MMHKLGGLNNFDGLEDDILISSPSRGNGAFQLSSSLHLPRGLHFEDHGQYATTTAKSFVSRSCRPPLRHSADCRISVHGAEDLKMMHELGGLGHFCGLEDHILQPGVLPLVATSSAGDRVVAAIFAAWIAFDSCPLSTSAAQSSSTMLTQW
ncbi:uncharacterized protein LOC144113644 [Amblyomma americanum]